MSGRSIVPGLIRRGNKFSVRIQVPKGLQDHIGRKEYWIKLGTEDRYQATSRALDIVRDKRNEFDQVRRRLEGDFRIAEELSLDEITALGLEVYNSFIKQAGDIEHGGKHMSPREWDAYVQPYEALQSQLENEFAREGGSHDFANNFADQVLDLNLIKLNKNSKSYHALCRFVLTAALEVQRRIVARLHGQEFPERLDPRFISTTGEVHQFVPVRDQSKQEPHSASIHALVGRYVSSTHLVRSEKTKKSLRSYLETMAVILGPDKNIRTISHANCLEAKEIIQQLPSNFKRHQRFRGLPPKKIAEIANREDLPRLSPQGVNNYIDALYAFLRWCHGSEMIDRIPIRHDLLRVADPVAKEDKRHPFTPDQLQTIFSSGIYQDGPRDSSMFWVPLIALWNGMRSNEICQLDTEDLCQEDGIWCFDITSISVTGKNDKSTKTQSSARILPIHPQLLKIGLIEFYQSRPHQCKLFGDLTLGADGYYSTAFSKRINRYFMKLGVHGPKHKFHSLRHNFRDEMRRVELDPGVARALGGWTNRNSEAFEIYGRGYSLGHLERAIRKIDYPGLNLGHLVKHPLC